VERDSASFSPENYDQGSVSEDDLFGGRVVKLFDTFNLRARFSKESGVDDKVFNDACTHDIFCPWYIPSLLYYLSYLVQTK